jgi:hypothetical protein
VGEQRAWTAGSGRCSGGMSRAECGRQEADRNWWGGAGGQEQVEAVLGRVSSP